MEMKASELWFFKGTTNNNTPWKMIEFASRVCARLANSEVHFQILQCLGFPWGLYLVTASESVFK